MAASKPKTKRVTLADVAGRAGVSVATASVAITGRPSGNCRVSPAVADKIRAVARELNYRPNLQARSLSTQRTHTVAMLIKRAAWHNAMYYVSAAQVALRSHGYTESFMLHNNAVLDERANLEICIQRGVEGILALPLIDPEGQANVETYNQLHTQEQIPVVQLGLALPGCVAPAVTADMAGGVAKTVTLLHAMGHRHIALAVTAGYEIETPLSPYQFARQIYRGYRQGISSVGLRESIFVSERPKTDVVEHYELFMGLAQRIAREKERPTAVIAVSAYGGVGLSAGITAAGLRVPEDVSIIACGDQPFARMMRPSLATLSEAYEKMGTLATEMLLKLIDNKPVESVTMMPSINLRDSVCERT